MAAVPSVAAEEQHEQLRRFVDEWASERGGTLDSLAPSNAPPVLEALDISTDPIGLTTTPIEHASVQSLIHTSVDNTPFAKLMTVAGYLCAEIEHIRARAHTHIFPALIAFGERPEEIPQEGELQLLLAHKLPLLIEAAGLFRRLRQVLQNLVLQLGALYPPPEPPKKTPPSQQVFASFRDIRLGTALESLGVGFSVLATLDEIVAWNAALAQAFSMFKRTLETVRSDPEHFGFEGENVGELDRALEELKGGVGILGGGMLRGCFAADFYAPLGEMQTLRSKPGQLLEEIGRHVKDTLGQVTARVGGPNERPNDRGSLLGALCNYLLCLWLSGEGKAPDRRLGRPVWELHRRVPLIPLVSAIRVQPNTFLMAHLPPGFAKGGLGQLVKEPLREAATARAEFLARLDEDLGRETVALLRAASAWLVRMESAAAIQGPIHTLLSGRLKLLVQGLLLATRVTTLMRTSVDLHTSLEVAISKEQITHIGRLAGLLKAIEAMFFRRGGDTALAIGHMIRTAQERVRKILEPLRDAVEADLEVLIARSNSLAAKLRTFARGPSDEDVKLADALAATDLALRMSEGPPSVQRRIVLSLSLDVVKSNLVGRLPPELTSELDDVIMLLSLGADVDQQIRDTCDCSFLHWSRKALLPVALKVPCQPPSRPHLIPDLVAAFVDGLRLLRGAGADDDVISSVEGEIEAIVTQEVIAPLCHAIDTDLRLHNHSHTLTGAVTLDPTRTGVRDLSYFLSMRSIRLGSLTIVVKERLEAYLNTALYDHTAVALHNWKAYSNMRQLAQDKYGIRLDDIHLPPQNLEHGLDVLFLMRSIHTLAQQYTYDLNGQVFIERPSAARRRKHLHTVKVRNIANGINTHGLGVVTTAINFAYQFLAKRLVALSQALYDDEIKSRMVKERKYYRGMMDQKADVNRHGGKGDLPGEYPVARAQKLIKDIKKLRKAESDPSALDVLRGLIGEIGNALGFVRMVANGASQHCADAVQFTPPSLFTPPETSPSKPPNHSVPPPPEHSLSTPSEQGLSTAQDCRAPTPPERSVLAAPEESAFTPLGGEQASTSGREHEAQSFEGVTLAAGVNAPSALRAARGLDATLRTLTERGAKDSAHFLRMLASVFSRELQTDQNRHLGTFFLLVPALMTSSTEAMLAGKEQLAKKGAKETRGTGPQPLFTDDGFALGLAYLLEVLGQGRAFDSLGWLTSAQAHFASEMATCDAAYSTLVNIGSGMQGLQSWSKRVGGTTEAEAHNLELVRKRLELFMREFELQSLNFESARAFFS